MRRAPAVPSTLTTTASSFFATMLDCTCGTAVGVFRRSHGSGGFWSRGADPGGARPSLPARICVTSERGQRQQQQPFVAVLQLCVCLRVLTSGPSLVGVPLSDGPGFGFVRLAGGAEGRARGAFSANSSREEDRRALEAFPALAQPFLKPVRMPSPKQEAPVGGTHDEGATAVRHFRTPRAAKEGKKKGGPSTHAGAGRGARAALRHAGSLALLPKRC
ncbi:hypothetical protein HPB47_012407 [Ixodes persulcatus]|uniref:Uncharacterized protein n=1 Tax=Ixodes persulcatus TaxID=34615 RepID=A0AC60NTT8_IXOPE|nr:hypothetical protein HPB47_012407 [Ixodes persulcatus]